MQKTLRPDLVISSLLRPLVRFCVLRGVRIQEVEELVRRSLVEAAHSTIKEAGGEVSTSKISVTTGIHRVEVARVLSGETRPGSKHDVLNRVIGFWSQHKSLRSEDGSPRSLTFEGTSSEFAELVASISKEVTHYPILFELERIGAIEYEGQRVRLRAREYLPQGDVEHGLDVLSHDIEDLLATVERNLTSQTNAPDLHLRTVYDNIDPQKLPEIREHINKRGIEFHKEMRHYLSALDRDVSPELVADNSRGSTPRARVVVGAFSQGHTIQEAKEIKPRKRGRKPCKPRD
jgi:hypothetical protein